MSNSFGARARKFMGWYPANEPIDQFDQFEDFDEVDEVEEVAPVADITPVSPTRTLPPSPPARLSVLARRSSSTSPTWARRRLVASWTSPPA